MSKIKITQNINAWVGGNVVPLHVGQEIEKGKFSEHELDNLLRGGYAIEEKPAVKVVSKPKEPAQRKRAVKVVKSDKED